MQNSDFISASAYIRVLEKRLLSDGGINRIVDVPGVQEVLHLVSQNSDYNFSSLQKTSDYEDVLRDELKRVYSMAYGLVKDSHVVDVLACKYDFHNLKAALKEKYYKGRTPPPYIALTKTDPGEIEAMVNNLANRAYKPSLPAHLTAAATNAVAAFEQTQNPQSIDTSLDRAMFAHMLSHCRNIGSDIITKHVRAAIDFHNIKTLLRAKNMKKDLAFLQNCFVEGGTAELWLFAECHSKTPEAIAQAFYYKSFGEIVRKGVESFERTGSFAGLERLFDNYLIEETKQAKYITYGPEILYAYLFSKENEIRQIRILVAGKQNGIAPDALKERLRENYA